MRYQLRLANDGFVPFSATLRGHRLICLNVLADADRHHVNLSWSAAALDQAIPAALREPSALLAAKIELKPDIPAGFLEGVESLVASLLLSNELTCVDTPQA